MRIAIFGAGAIGGYFGGRLAQAGMDVAFIARGSHLDALQADGLQVKSVSGDFRVAPIRATSRPQDVGAVDVVFCCVKSWQVAEACEAIRSLMGPQSVVIPLQNGVEAHTTLSEALGEECVLPGLCRLISMIETPGRIHHAGGDPYLAFGEINGRLSHRAQALAQILSGAQGMTVEVSENIIADLWKKFMLIAPWGGVGAITRSPIGVFRSLPETRTLLQQSVQEVFAVGRAHGVALGPETVAATLAFIDQLPPEGTASMQRDIMEGRPSELHEQCGAVVRFGENGGVPTPLNRFIYHSLLPLERKARGS